MSYLQWKKSGRTECGKYQASKNGAWHLPVAHYRDSVATEKLAGAAASAAYNRAACQRHAWKIASQQAISEACLFLTTAMQTGAAKISHTLGVDSSQVSRWKLGRALVPARHVQQLSFMCPMRINQTLRPDLEFFHDESGALKWRKRSVIQGGAES